MIKLVYISQLLPIDQVSHLGLLFKYNNGMWAILILAAPTEFSHQGL